MEAGQWGEASGEFITELRLKFPVCCRLLPLMRPGGRIIIVGSSAGKLARFTPRIQARRGAQAPAARGSLAMGVAQRAPAAAARMTFRS